jgi:glycosyltransferase involved in cell wall biosynthesis
MAWANGLETRPQVAFVSTYPPTECGLATFTYDLLQAVERHGWSGLVVSADHEERKEHPDPRVIYQIRRESVGDYVEAAERLNCSNVRVVSLQHEYGIFGGEMGEYIIPFVRRLEVPLVTTLHTVVPRPTEVIARPCCAKNRAAFQRGRGDGTHGGASAAHRV